MTYYIRRGSAFNVTTKEQIDIQEKLPAATYTIKFDQMSSQFFLELIEGFKVSGKIYGDTNKQADRILDTFADRPNSTGVMLSGEKGSGKTLLAEIVSLKAMDKTIPTLVINAPWCGEGFNSFIQSIDEPLIVIFDEFEKVYDKEEQEQLLTLLDGVYPSKKLFILTCNDRYQVNSHMQNRPGRIFYRLDYKGLSTDFIREYCQDNLRAQEHTEAICRISAAFDQFNFDILKALVEEMNRYNETPQEAMQMLNAKPESDTRATYNVELKVDGKIVIDDTSEDGSWRGNPLAQQVSLMYINPKPSGKKDSDDDPIDYWLHSTFSPADLVKVDADKGEFIFTNRKGEIASLVRHRTASFEYYGAY